MYKNISTDIFARQTIPIVNLSHQPLTDKTRYIVNVIVVTTFSSTIPNKITNILPNLKISVNLNPIQITINSNINQPTNLQSKFATHTHAHISNTSPITSNRSIDPVLIPSIRLYLQIYLHSKRVIFSRHSLATSVSPLPLRRL